MDYKLSNLVSIFNTTCSQFASVIYHGFHWKVYKRFSTHWSICPYKLCVIKQTLIANIPIIIKLPAAVQYVEEQPMNGCSHYHDDIAGYPVSSLVNIIAVL